MGAAPVLAAPDGAKAALIALSPEIQAIRDRLRLGLKERGLAMNALGPLADEVSLHVFEIGARPFSSGWTADYAGRRYPFRHRVSP